MALKVVVNQQQCIGAASCVAIAPNSFKLNDDNVSQFIGNGDPDETIMSAAQACPVTAIEVYEVDEQGNETKIWPKA